MLACGGQFNWTYSGFGIGLTFVLLRASVRFKKMYKFSLKITLLCSSFFLHLAGAAVRGSCAEEEAGQGLDEAVG